MKICVLIPVHNEAQTIGQLVSGLKERSLDALVVDDGSSDGSGKIAQENGAFIIRNNKKMGKGVSLQRGFSYILKRDYEGIVTMDGDGQHDIGDIDKFVEKAGAYPNCVITGNRMSNTKGMPFIRYLTNHIMSGLISFICKQTVKDTQCGYRYIGCGILKGINLSCGDFEIETEILIKSSKKGFNIYSVPVKTIYRNEKSKIDPFKDTIRFFVYLSKELFSKEEK
jgi:glycosyltransferase involved in cell wall biosynthesis